MEIVIENCSSPGAHFSDNTNNVILKIYDWLVKNHFPTITFTKLKNRIGEENSINDNNARTIYPLLRNCGFVEYQGRTQEEIDTNNFFSTFGLAYINALKLKKTIIDNNIKEALKSVDNIIGLMIFEALKNLLGNKELNYSESFRWFLMFLDCYKKINIQEFAVMVYVMTENPNNWKDKIDGLISQYRDGKLDLEIKIKVRNDKKIQESSGEKFRNESIKFFTSFNYYATLLVQAGLIVKNENNYFSVSEKNKIEILLGD